MFWIVAEMKSNYKIFIIEWIKFHKLHKNLTYSNSGHAFLQISGLFEKLFVYHQILLVLQKCENVTTWVNFIQLKNCGHSLFVGCKN